MLYLDLDEVFTFLENIEDTDLVGGWSIVDKKASERSYEYFKRAELFLEEYDDRYDLIDAIASLKRSLDTRLKLIEKNLNLKKICNNKHYLEILGGFNIVRPYLHKRLLEIRNELEHEDNDPPSHERCKELVDIQWLFLKSTNDIVRQIPTDIEIVNPTEFFLGISYDFEEHKDIKLRGKLPLHMFHLENKNTFIEVLETNNNAEVLNFSLIITPEKREYHKLIKYYFDNRY